MISHAILLLLCLVRLVCLRDSSVVDAILSALRFLLDLACFSGLFPPIRDCACLLDLDLCF